MSPPKPYTVMIPEPDKSGFCNESCPFIYYDRKFEDARCAGGLGEETSSGDRPGPKCPQWQGGEK